MATGMIWNWQSPHTNCETVYHTANYHDKHHSSIVYKMTNTLLEDDKLLLPGNGTSS